MALRTARKQQQAKGLVVLCATYGSKAPDADHEPNYQPATPRDVGTEDASQVLEPPPAWLDVTVALQYAVQDGLLSIPPGVPLMHRMGFYDPSPEAEKVLRVEYMHRSDVGAVWGGFVGDNGHNMMKVYQCMHVSACLLQCHLQHTGGSFSKHKPVMVRGCSFLGVQGRLSTTLHEHPPCFLHCSVSHDTVTMVK